MSALPEQYQRFAQPGPHPIHGQVELYDDRDPIVYVPDAYGQLVPMRKSQAPATVQPSPPRDLTPQPLFDPIAQRLAAGGVLGAGVGWGAAQILTAIAGAGAGLLAFALLLLAARLGGARSVTNVRQEVHNHNRWWGSSSTEL